MTSPPYTKIMSPTSRRGSQGRGSEGYRGSSLPGRVDSVETKRRRDSIRTDRYRPSGTRLE